MGESEFFAQRSTLYPIPASERSPRRLGDADGAPSKVAAYSTHASPLRDDARARMTFGMVLVLATSFYVVAIS